MKRTIAVILLIALMATLAVGCQKDPSENYPSGNLDFVAPGGAGGGWDTTIRAVAQTLQATGLVEANMPVRNNPGASGAKHIAEIQKQEGNDTIIFPQSSPLLLNYLSGTSEYSYENTTPICNLIADYAAFAVAADSPYQDMNDLFDAIKADPGSVSIVGNSSLGSMDHIQFLIIAKAAGIEDISKINYISVEEAASAQVVGGHVDVISTGLTEIQGLVESGDLRALGQTSDKTINGIPSCVDQGIDATFVNWRGVFAAPGMPDYAVSYWSEALENMIETPEWQAQLEKYNWDAYYVPYEEYGAFLEKAQTDFESVLEELGMLNK
jgi:putative tricarboxylic transport membrane protein